MDHPVLAFIASCITMFLGAVGFLLKKKSQYLLSQIIGMCFLITSYLLSASYFAMIGLSIGLLRTVTFFIYENKGIKAPLFWPFIFSGLTIASYFIVNLGILHNAKPIDILYVMALIFYAFIFRIRNLKTVRFTMLIPTNLAILHCILVSPAALPAYLFELGGNLVSIFKYHVFNKKETVQEEKEEEVEQQEEAV